MSTAYEEIGRVDQKRRTRAALLDAARALIARGESPTVEEAAAEAHVSRTTAYRYFPSQRDLLVAAYPQIDAQSLVPDELADEGPAARFEAVVDTIIEHVVRDEPQLRTMLRLALEGREEDRDKLVLRQGRAITWLEDALAPLRSTVRARERRRLVLATRAAIGIEAFVWLTDVARLSPAEAAEVMRWSARSLYTATVGDEEARPRA